MMDKVTVQQNSESFGHLSTFNEVMKVLLNEPGFHKTRFKISGNTLHFYDDGELLFSIEFPSETDVLLDSIALTTGVGIYACRS